MYAFMYRVSPKYNSEEKELFVVKVAKCFDYVEENVRWMADKRMGDFVLVPHLDIEESHHEFAIEEAALNFIKEWWKKQ